MSKPTAEQFLKWLQCVQSGTHDFSQGNVCPRCGANKGDANLLDVIRHAKIKKENPYAQ